MADIQKIFQVMLDDKFKEILQTDPVLQQLEKSKFNIKDEYFQLMLVLNRTLKICGLPCQVLTPAIWSFLYTIQNAFVTHEKITKKDIDVFLYILHTGFKNIDEDLYQKSKDFCIKKGISYIEAEADIYHLIYLSFRALQMFPQVLLSDEKNRFDIDWLTKICSMVCSMTNYQAEFVMYECSLTECFYYIVQYARQKDTKNQIRRRNSDEINALMYNRTMELGQKYYKENYEGK